MYATLLAFALSFLDPSRRMTPPRLFEALAKGATGVLPVAATTAAAGLIVAVLTLTGLGLDLSSIIVDLAAVVADSPTGVLLVTCVLSAVAVLVLGLAVPVTASFIIAAVIIAPALTELGVARPEAYMFIFHYAVLSEVSPPTALAAVAAAAITGGNAFATMIATFKYPLPAFLVPLAFVLTPNGEGLLGQGPLPAVLLVTAVSALAVAALAVTTGRWMFGPARWPERALSGLAAVLLLDLETPAVLAGLAVLAVAVLVHLLGRRRPPSAVPASAAEPATPHPARRPPREIPTHLPAPVAARRQRAGPDRLHRGRRRRRRRRRRRWRRLGGRRGRPGLRPAGRRRSPVDRHGQHHRRLLHPGRRHRERADRAGRGDRGDR